MHYRNLVILLIGIVILGGCGSKSKPLTPVKGVLKIDGVPAKDIIVQFMPDASKDNAEGPTSTAVTGEGGQFELMTTDNRVGAVIGPHVVTLFDQAEDRPAQGEEQTRPSRLNSSYGTEKGGLRVEVEPDKEIVLDAKGAGR